jgi:predicted metal-dependent HD superfamily phosphohydrolase
MPTRERWQATWSGLGLEAPPRLYEDVCLRYGEPHRAYHTLRHLEECFAHFERARHLAAYPAEVELALWLHDVIYDPRAADSEERSAAFTSQALGAGGASPAQEERVAGLVLATKHATAQASGDHAVLLDVDLSILGAPRTRFIEYEAQVRREYAWVPEEAFRKARSAILARFLERPRIYATHFFSDLLETQARSNLRDSLERMRA